MSCSTALEVPMKFEIVRNGVVEEVRRRRLVNPTFEVVSKVVKELVRGQYRIEYIDEDGDVVTMDTEEEWEECMCLWKQLNTLRLRINLLSSARSSSPPCRSRSPPTQPHCGTFPTHPSFRGGRRQGYCYKWRRGGDGAKTAEAPQQEQQQQQPPQPCDIWQEAARTWFASMKNHQQTSCSSTEPEKTEKPDETKEQQKSCPEADPWQSASRWWYSAMKKNQQKQCRRRGQQSTEGGAVGETCRSCKSFKTTRPETSGHCCFKCMWTAGARHGPHCQQQRADPSEQTKNTADLETVKKVLDQLFGNGDEVLTRILEGQADEKTLGCDAWLKVLKGDNGEIDLDVDTSVLATTLMELGLQAMKENNKQTAVKLFELCTEVGQQGHAFYNLACAKLMGHDEMAEMNAEAEAEVDQALSALEQAVQAGYSNFLHMFADEDLKTLRTNPRFQELIPAVVRNCGQKFGFFGKLTRASTDPEQPKDSSSPSSSEPAPEAAERKETETPEIPKPAEAEATQQSSPVQTPETSVPEQQPVPNEQPAPQPTQQPQPESRYTQQIKTLQDMGLMQPEVMELVEKFAGDLNQVIAAIMN